MLARVDLPLPRRVGRYGVDVRAFDAFLKGLDTRSRVLLIDEIGKMECFSPTFRGLIHHWPDGPAVVVTTVAEKGPGLIRDVKLCPGCDLHLLHRPTADLLAERLERWVRARLGEAPEARSS